MKSRNSRANSGYVGQNRLSDDYGVISENKNYLRSNLTQWIRPANWLPLPSMTAGDQMFAGLLAVYPGDPALTGPTASGNFVAFSVTGCTYTVDWGNGTTQSYSAGATAQYNFDFGSISAATTITGVEGLSGYRQTVITAYPTVAGTTFSGINLSAKYFESGVFFDNYLGTNWAPTWLDMRIAGSDISSFKFNTPFNNRIKQFEWVGNSGITNGVGLFSSAKKIKSFIGTSWTSNIIDFANMFSSCTSLETIPLLNTANGTNFTNMFLSCSNLYTIPLLNTASGTYFSTMFRLCTSLEMIPLLNTSSGTSFNAMFSSCPNLQTIPLLDTSSGTNFAGMFTLCPNIQTIPLLDTSSGTDFSSMFNTCSSLETIPLLNTANGLTFHSMFANCSSLETIPLLDTSKGKNIQSMFQSCSSLQTIPLLDFRAVTTAGTSIFPNCSNLKQAATQWAAAPSVPLSFDGCNLSPRALDQIFTNLPTVTGSKICNVSNNWGSPLCNRSIAQNKGWTVVP